MAKRTGGAGQASIIIPTQDSAMMERHPDTASMGGKLVAE